MYNSVVFSYLFLDQLILKSNLVTGEDSELKIHKSSVYCDFIERKVFLF